MLLKSNRSFQDPDRTSVFVHKSSTLQLVSCFVVQGSVLDSVVIHQQVHLLIPCYDFYPVQAIAINLLSYRSEPKSAWLVRRFLETTQSRVATGGVYKGQGRNQCKLMTRIYLEFLVHERKFQHSIPAIIISQLFAKPCRARTITLLPSL